MDTKLCVRLAVAAAAFILAALPAAAAEDCKTPVTAEGKPASMRDLGAYPNSLFAWRSAVKDKFGHEYNSWRYAQDKKVDCVEKGGQWVCTRTAKPCIDMLHSLTGKAKETVAKKDCKSEELSSYGARKGTRKEAEEQSVFGWEIDTRKKHGKEWAVWKNASDVDIDCREVKQGFQCIAVGTACMPKG
jgi:hypothetical protein